MQQICTIERTERCGSGIFDGSGKKLDALSAVVRQEQRCTKELGVEEDEDGELQICIGGQGEEDGGYAYTVQPSGPARSFETLFLDISSTRI